MFASASAYDILFHQSRLEQIRYRPVAPSAADGAGGKFQLDPLQRRSKLYTLYTAMLRSSVSQFRGSGRALQLGMPASAASPVREVFDRRKGAARRFSSRPELPSSVGGVIIGGGVSGCSLAWNLAKRGVDTLLLEKGELASGATWHAAGLVTNYHGGNNFRFWHAEGINQFTHWQKECGYDLSFHMPGSIRLYPHGQGYVDEANHQLAKGELYRDLFGGPEIKMLSPSEIKKLHPLCDVENTDLYCGLMTFDDGHIDPSSVTNRFADEAKQAGARIHRFTEVVATNLRPDGKWEVLTRDQDGNESRTVADFVVNAAGLWCDTVGKMAGVHIPSVVLQHQYVITETIPEVKAFQEEHGHQLPVLRDLKGSFYLRDERDGILIGPYEAESSVVLSPDSWIKNGMPSDNTYFLFEGDTDRLMPHLERAMELVPPVGSVGIKSVINGPTCWPADGAHLVGPTGQWDKAPNYWLACAESYGIAHSAGLGRYLAEWIVNGEPPYELTEADPARYGEWATKDWVKEKVKETYGMNNHVHFPNENLMGARPVMPLKNEGIYRRLEANGCQFGFHHGWEGPNFFLPNSQGEQVGNKYATFRRPGNEGYIEAECQKLFEFGGICYWPFAKYRVSGQGAVKLLDTLSANKLPRVGRCQLCHFLTPKGKVYSEVTIARLAEDEFYIVSYPEMEMHDWRWMHMHAPNDGSVSIKNITDEYGTLMVNGPNSLEALAKLAPSVDWTSFKFYEHREVELAGVRGHALKVSFTGEEGMELHMPLAELGLVYDALKTAEPRLCDWGGIAMGSFRLEKGIRAAGSDFTKDHNALEAGLGKFLKVDDKDFIGRDAIKAMRDEFREKHGGNPSQVSSLMEMHTPEGIECVGNEPLLDRTTGEIVGYTTSGGYGHITQKSIAFGYIQRQALGRALAVRLLGETYDVSVRDEPFMEMAAQRARKAKASLEAPPTDERKKTAEMVA